MKHEQVNKYYALGSDGFIALKDFMGSDETIEQAARISYGKGTRKKSETRGLIRYLKRNWHTSPFEQAEIQFHIRVPMDAWRQWIRHRTANVNEYSTRYSEAIDARATTDPDKWRLQSGSNKQGSSGYLERWTEDILKVEGAHEAGLIKINGQRGISPGNLLSIKEQELHDLAQKVYQQRVDMGVAREQARKDLPLSTYTEAFWKCDLHNLMHFCKLRCDPHAQIEIREFANVIAGIIKEIYPLSYEAWYDYQHMTQYMSRLDMLLLQEYIFHLVGNLGDMSKEDIEEFAKEIGMSKREIDDWFKKVFEKTYEQTADEAFDLSSHPLYDMSTRMNDE